MSEANVLGQGAFVSIKTVLENVRGRVANNKICILRYEQVLILIKFKRRFRKEYQIREVYYHLKCFIYFNIMKAIVL